MATVLCTLVVFLCNLWESSLPACPSSCLRTVTAATFPPFTLGVLPIAVGDVTVADSVVPVGVSVVRVPVFAIAISCVIVILVQVAIVTVLVECLGPSMY